VSGLALTKTTLDVRPRAAVRQSHILSESDTLKAGPTRLAFKWSSSAILEVITV